MDLHSRHRLPPHVASRPASTAWSRQRAAHYARGAGLAPHHRLRPRPLRDAHRPGGPIQPVGRCRLSRPPPFRRSHQVRNPSGRRARRRPRDSSPPLAVLRAPPALLRPLPTPHRHRRSLRTGTAPRAQRQLEACDEDSCRILNARVGGGGGGWRTGRGRRATCRQPAPLSSPRASSALASDQDRAKSLAAVVGRPEADPPRHARTFVPLRELTSVPQAKVPPAVTIRALLARDRPGRMAVAADCADAGPRSGRFRVCGWS